MDYLKPCPLCGARDAFVECMTLSSAAVMCAGPNGCGARGPERDIETDADLHVEEQNEWCSGEAAARRAWNNRPTQMEASHEMRRLRAVLYEIQGLCPTSPEATPTATLGGYYGSQLQAVGNLARASLSQKEQKDD